MKFIFILFILLIFGLILGYFKIVPNRASVEMGDFDLEIPDKDEK